LIVFFCEIGPFGPSFTGFWSRRKIRNSNFSLEIAPLLKEISAFREKLLGFSLKTPISLYFSRLLGPLAQKHREISQSKETIPFKGN